MAKAKSDKYVGIKVGDLSLPLIRVTEVKESEEIDSDMVKTFDEPVPVPSSDGGYSIDISMIEARSLDEFKTLKKIIKELKKETGSLLVRETVRFKNGDEFDSERHYSELTLSSNEVTVSAEDLTARDLSFTASQLREVVDGEEI